MFRVYGILSKGFGRCWACSGAGLFIVDFPIVSILLLCVVKICSFIVGILYGSPKLHGKLQ